MVLNLFDNLFLIILKVSRQSSIIKNSTYYFDFKLQFYVFFSAKMINTHTFLSQIELTQVFCCKNDFSTLVLLQKRFTHTFFVNKTIYALLLSQKEFTHTFYIAKTIYVLFLSRKRFTHFIRKVFAR